ncbi:MAG: hypothetical protein H7Y17_11535 [Chlorobia bacterium]|nr:hypothetical protein [Fimbriimonadaceae bacterium]
MSKTGDVMLRIELEDGQDPELLERLTNEIREHLLEAEVAESVSSQSGEAPAGSKSAEWLEIGALSLQLFVYSIKAVHIVKEALHARGLKGSLEAGNGAQLNLATASAGEQEQFIQSAQ